MMMHELMYVSCGFAGPEFGLQLCGRMDLMT